MKDNPLAWIFGSILVASVLIRLYLGHRNRRKREVGALARRLLDKFADPAGCESAPLDCVSIAELYIEFDLNLEESQGITLQEIFDSGESSLLRRLKRAESAHLELIKVKDEKAFQRSETHIYDLKNRLAELQGSRSYYLFLTQPSDSKPRLTPPELVARAG